MLKQTAADWAEDKAMKLSAALALYAILSLAPLLVVSIKILSMIFGQKAAAGQVQRQMNMLVGHAGSQAVQEMIANAAKPGAGVVATLISLAIVLFSASGVFGELQDSLNIIWEVKPKPHQGVWATVKSRLLSIGMVFTIAFLLLISLFISTLLTTLTGSLLPSASAAIAIAIDILVSIVVVSALMAMIFRILPDVKVAWRDVLVGALLTGILFKLGQYGLGLYFKFGSSTSAYGAAGSFVAVLLWVYYSAWILFFGAEFTQVWSKSHGRWPEPSDNAVKVTDEDRAQLGMVSPKRLQCLASTDNNKTSLPPTRSPAMKTSLL
jgi:membrane protein